MNNHNFPFSAIIGQPDLKDALLISAIDPRMGGVLISGPRGSAKSTIARSLADLIPGEVFVNLPLGASEEKLLGSLDLSRALSQREVEFSDGLLAKAHQGILYVDEVNLLADHLVDLLLDVAASGVNQVERDGISHQHSADFLLIGTMNPDEGELRPQLLDRFGLMVDLDHAYTINERKKIIQQRLDFDENTEQFLQRYKAEQKAISAQIRSAKEILNKVNVADDVQQYIAEICSLANVEGLRADIIMYRASRAYAALHQLMEVSKQEVDAVKHFVLLHRQNAMNTSIPESINPPASSAINSQVDDKKQSSIQGSWGAMQAQTQPVTEGRKLPETENDKPLKKKHV